MKSRIPLLVIIIISFGVYLGFQISKMETQKLIEPHDHHEKHHDEGKHDHDEGVNSTNK